MTIRLTDFDQDDHVPIEMIRDPVGVLLTDDSGWSAVSVKANFAESGAGSPSGLPGSMSWIVNKPFDQVNALRMTMGQSNLRVRAADWMKPDLDEVIEDWDVGNFSRQKRAEFLAKCIDRILRLSYEAIRIHSGLSPVKEQALLDMFEKSGSLPTGIRIVLSPEMERDLSNEKKLSVATFTAMKFGAFVREDLAVTGDDVMVRLRPPRFGYAEAVLSRPVPSGGKWQQAKLDESDVLNLSHLEELRRLGRPVLVSARVQAIRGAEDPLLATWATPNGQGYVRKTYTLDEVVEMFGSYTFSNPMIMVGPGWKRSAAAAFLDAIQSACGLRELANASWSAGILAENALCGAMRNGRAPRGKTEGMITPESVWIGAHDRIAMRPFIKGLSGFGVNLVGGYAGGIRFKAPRDPEVLSSVINAAWEIGLHAQMSLSRQVREMGGEILADKKFYGGDHSHILAPLLTQAGRIRSLWKIDEIIELPSEARVNAFLKLIGE